MANILFVEDELWLAELYQKLLTNVGHNVHCATDGYLAMDLIEEQLPDLIILDIMLPWVNGLQLLHEFAAHADLAAIPVIICSNALPKGTQADHFRAYGIVKMLDKANMRPAELLAAVAEAL